MAKSAYDLFKEGASAQDIGNPQLRQELMRLQRDNYNQQLEQVNANYQAWRKDNEGVAIGDYFAQVNAGKKNTYAVKDGDTLSTISKNTGLPEADLLNANPDMKSPQVGMVLNTPQPSSNYFNSEKGLNTPVATPLPGSEAWRVQQQNKGGFGLPSNAAQGGTTTNPQGFNPYAAASQAQLQAYGAAIGNAQNKPPVAGAQARMNQFAQMGQNLQNNLAGLNQLRQAQMGAPVNGQTSFQQIAALRATAGQGLDALRSAQMGQTPKAPAAATQQPASAVTDSLQAAYNRYPSRSDETKWYRAFNEKFATGNLSQAEIDTAVYAGLIKPTDPKANGGINGNYTYGAMQFRRRKYGGGGGYGGYGGGGYGGYSRGRSRQPAFSAGSGFKGLVNWRV